ncbi:hypothetical protein CK203_029899 [Vitis vinifera]|uniref:Uncharacterized protein n=1 Tax=Vitis vinifera TaxID=29760 RepID=A0A438IDK0_VITVI|nr:hypothetical protein CK203_029899 [Vitis vinifera]
MSEPKVLQYDFILRRQRSLTLVNTQDDILLMALGSSSRIYRLSTSLALPILLHIHNSFVKEEILDSLSSKWPDSLIVQPWLEVLDYCFPRKLVSFAPTLRLSLQLPRICLFHCHVALLGLMNLALQILNLRIILNIAVVDELRHEYGVIYILSQKKLSPLDLARKRERNTFVVESKIFEIDVEVKRGKYKSRSGRKKKGISSWVRLGSASLGFLLESLDHCIKDGKGGKWERDWKENGRSYSLVRNENKAGLFLRLGVVDLEKKQHSIIIPKGRGEKGGWVTMAEKLQQMGAFIGRKEHKQLEWGGGKLVLERSYAEVVKRQKNRDKKLVRMELTRGEGPGDFGAIAGKIWGLKGNLGLARLEENRVLLEFKLLGEAIWVMSFGNDRLPLSIWNPNILRRVGEECGGFIAMDPRTEKLQELQWAQILIRTEGEDLPSVLEIAVEEKVYSLASGGAETGSEKGLGNRREANERTRGEVRGDGVSRADTRVEKELENSRLGGAAPVRRKDGGSGGRVGQGASQTGARHIGSLSIHGSCGSWAFVVRPRVGLKRKKKGGGLYTQGTTVGLNLKLKEVMGEVVGPEVGRRENGGPPRRKAHRATGKWIWMTAQASQCSKALTKAIR